MATGDKLYIADKLTLDEVKSTVDIIKSTSDSIKTGTDNVKSVSGSIKAVVDTTKTTTDDIKTTVLSTDASIKSIQKTKAFYTPGDISKLNYSQLNTSIGTTPNNILNLTTPGTLYYVVASASAATTSGATNTTMLTVIADGVTLYNFSIDIGYGSNASNIGLITHPSIVGTAGNNNIQLINGLTLASTSALPFSRGTNGYTMIAIKPIRWETSLIVRAVSSANASFIYSYYELDQ